MLRIRSGNEMEKLLDSQNMGQNKKYKSIRIMKNGTLTEDPWGYEKHEWGMEEDETHGRKKKKKMLMMKVHELVSS